MTPIISPSKMIIDNINWEPDEASAGTTGSMKIVAQIDGDVSTYGDLDCYQCQGFDYADTGITIVDPAAGTCDDSNGVKESMADMVVKSLVLGENYYFKCRARNVLGWGDWSDKSEAKVSANVPLAPSVFNLISSFTTVSFKVTPISNGHRKVHYMNKYVFIYGLLYSGYRKDRWWWESVVLLRKFLVIVVTAFLYEDSMQLHVMMMILIVAFALHHTYLPFHVKQSDDHSPEEEHGVSGLSISGSSISGSSLGGTADSISSNLSGSEIP